MAERLTTFLTANKLIDPELQKAFLPGINGVIEHNHVMDEIVKDAKHKNRTCHIAFFDLEDAFGSVPHSLIDLTLERNFIPPVIRKYFHTLYTHSSAVVQTSKWRSNQFPFKRGVFQGDPISPVIFLLVFNPILQKLQMNSHKGYKLGEVSHVTTPYADDFCLITRDKRTQQNLIGDSEISSIRDEEQKFLGKLLFFKGKPQETFNLVKDTFVKGIERIGAAMVRDEFKLWMYTNYLLPSKRFLLTIHTLTDTQLKSLDTLTDKAIKS